MLTDAKRQKRDHLIAMVSGNYGGNYGREYVEQRLRLGALYATVGLDFQAFLGAFYHLMRSIASAVILRAGSYLTVAFENFLSLKKIELLDIGLILQVIVAEKESVFGGTAGCHTGAINPGSTGADRLLVLPIIGVLDSPRAKQLTDGLLHAIREKRAKVVVVDITGVAAVDLASRESPNTDDKCRQAHGRASHRHRAIGRCCPIIGCLGCRSPSLEHGRRSPGRSRCSECIMGCKILRGVEFPAVPV